MRLKKLHILVLKAFLPPFIITLLVSVFLFFIVTVVITYLDDFLGKGLRTIDLLQLFVYAWIALIPQCIPLAVLLGSIMSFGNLAENYELAAMKSSGLSLFRIMRPALVFIFLLAGLTFTFNNFILPVVQLKSTSLLWDIRQKKPTVNIKEGIFYNKIDNYSIRVGKKSANKDTLKEIFIYDHTLRLGNTEQLYAESGKMSHTADSGALVLTLRNGNHYKETVTHQVSPVKRPVSQLNFRQLQVQIDLDLKLKRTDEKSWASGEEMLNIWQLDSVADSTRRLLNRKYSEVDRQVREGFYYRTNLSLKNRKKDGFVNLQSFYDSLSNDKFKMCIENALNLSRTNSGYFDGVMINIEGEQERYLSYLTEWHDRIVVCFACIVLFFVGAPLGAIIKKGGFGLPVVVSVFFYLAYFLFSQGFKSVALDGTLPPWQAMWMPLVIFFPVSAILTYKAARDSAILDFGAWFLWLPKLFKQKKNKVA